MDMKTNALFWNASIEEVEKGLIKNEEEYRCILCEEAFQRGQIFEIDSKLYDAKKAAELHVTARHGSMLEYLLGMNPAFTGLSEIQRELLVSMAQGLSDKDIAAKHGVAQSTIRNHRYKLREREKQAKLFLALMNLLAQNTSQRIHKLDQGVIMDAHKTATTVDDRYNITDAERDTVIKNHMDENGALLTYPAREKKKIIVLQEITKNFSKGKTYSEKEINRMLKRIYEDYATLRRALVEYGFIERTNDGGSYWVKE